MGASSESGAGVSCACASDGAHARKSAPRAAIRCARRNYLFDGNEKTAPSRTPADGQRCVIAFLRV
jgi:hypothetical protein